MQILKPCLWFNNQGEEAARFYISLFKNSSLGRLAHYGEAAAKASGRAKGSVMTVEFSLEGQSVLALNGGPHFQSTPALSFFAWRKTTAEVEALWKSLSAGGETRMGLDKYPWAPLYGWTKDRFGVEWQVMLSVERHAIAPCFVFVDQLFGKGEEAMRFYSTLFKDAKVTFMARDEKNNTLMHCIFTLAGQEFVVMDGPGQHGYTFSPAFSLIVNCTSQNEIDRYWSKLSTGDPSEQCGWVKDKYGVSWQIVPTVLPELMLNPKTSEKVMQALLQMKKIDIETLKHAAEKA